MSEAIKCGCGTPIREAAICSGCVIAAAEKITDLARQLDEAKTALAEWDNAAKFVADQKCMDQEQHCACVAIQQKRIARMEEQVSELLVAAEGLLMIDSIELSKSQCHRIHIHARGTIADVKKSRDALPGGDDDENTE